MRIIAVVVGLLPRIAVLLVLIGVLTVQQLPAWLGAGQMLRQLSRDIDAAARELQLTRKIMGCFADVDMAGRAVTGKRQTQVALLALVLPFCRGLRQRIAQRYRLL